MIKNYLKIAWRNLLKNKGYTTINILGLAVGVCSFMLISLFVINEFSYDTFHTKADRIYRIWQHENYGPKEDFVSTTTPVSMVGVLRENFPEIEAGARIYRFNSLVKKGNNEFNEAVRAVDPSFFKIFDFNLLEGNREAPFTDASSVILSESAAKKYFGDTQAVGQSLELKFSEETRIYTVSGIVEDPPEESSIQYGLLVSLENEPLFFNDRARRSWFNVVLESYIMLNPGQSPTQLEAKFPEVIRQYLGDNFEENTFFLQLQPLREIHLDTSLPAGLEPISNPKYSYIMATIGFLVLLLACINFVTLAVGRSFSRAIEVGVRKALGAFRQQIIYQFWGEALLITFFAVVFGILLAYVCLGTFNELTGKNLLLTLNLPFMLITIGMIAFISLVSGIYPSLILSRFNPVEVLRRKQSKGTSMGLFGKSLIVVQFVASIVMIISTLVISRQINYLVNKDLGYQKDAIVVVSTNKDGEEADKLADLYVDELKNNPQVSNASASLFSLIQNSWFTIGFTDNKDSYREFFYNKVDPQFLKTHSIQMVAGRDFQEGNASDAENGVLVNEAFVKKFGLSDPVGTLYDKFEVRILGIVKDFNYQPLKYEIEPLMLSINPDPVFRSAENVSSQFNSQPRVSARIDASNISAGIEVLRSAWTKVNPTQEFEYAFLDEALTAQYQTELRSKTIVNIASILAIFIACMGLFGQATLDVARRTSEIGIRKVMGASVLNIVSMISRDFIKLVLLAALLAFPIAWWGMNKWLQDFAYSMPVSWWIFALSAVVVVGITLLTVSFQSIKASLANPVESLRTE